MSHISELTSHLFQGDTRQPKCSLCLKADSICRYPTSRKRRTPRNRKPQQSLSALQVQDSRDITANGLQRSNITANDVEVSIPTQSNSDDLMYPIVRPDQSIELAPNMMTSPRIDAFVNLEIPDLFQDLGLSFVTGEVLDNESQGNSDAEFDAMVVDGQTISNLELSPIPRLDERLRTELTLPDASLSHITNEIVTNDAVERAKSNRFALEVPLNLVTEL